MKKRNRLAAVGLAAALAIGTYGAASGIAAAPASAAVKVCNSSNSTASLKVEVMTWSGRSAWVWVGPGKCRYDALGEIGYISPPSYHRAKAGSLCTTRAKQLARWSGYTFTTTRGGC